MLWIAKFDSKVFDKDINKKYSKKSYEYIKCFLKVYRFLHFHILFEKKKKETELVLLYLLNYFYWRMV